MARYWVGGGSSTNWNATVPTNWSATSGGANDASVPDSTQAVFFDANSGVGISNVSAAITIGSLDTDAYLGTITHGAFNVSIGNATMGDLILGSGMTLTNAASSNCKITLRSTKATANITTNGKVIRNLTINSAGGACTYTLQDNLTTTSTLAVLSGTLTGNGKDATVGTSFTLTNGIVNAGTGTWTTLNWVGSASANFNADTSTVIINGGQLQPDVVPYYNLTFSGAVTVNGALSDLEVSGTLSLSAGAVVTATAGMTWTVTGSIAFNGTSGNLVTMLSGTPSSEFYIVGPTGVHNYSYMSITDNNISGGTYNAFSSVNGGGNTGWNIVATSNTNQSQSSGLDGSFNVGSTYLQSSGGLSGGASSAYVKSTGDIN
jgi:hypothetical protein